MTHDSLQKDREAAHECSVITQKVLSGVREQIRRVRAKKIKQAACCGSILFFGWAAWEWLYCGASAEPCLPLTCGTFLCLAAACNECCDEKPDPTLPTSLHELREDEKVYADLCQFFEDDEKAIDTQLTTFKQN